MKITPITTGFLNKIGTDLIIRTTFATEDITCKIMYTIYTVNNETIVNGNFELTPQEYADWGYDNTYINDLVLDRLGLTRLIEE